MGERWAGLTCLLLLSFLLPFPAATEEERAPSLEFLPSSEVVPAPREREKEQPRVLFPTSVGGFGLSRGYFDAPIDVAHDIDSNYYVLDAGNNRVQKFTSRDRFDLEWGSTGAREGRFSHPQALAVDAEGYVYVVDTGNHRVQKFDSEGNFELSWGSLGSSPGKFNGPVDIAFDTDGNIYVLDAGNDRIQKFSSATDFEEEWGAFTGGREGDFKSLSSIAYDDLRFGYLQLLGAGVAEGTCQVQSLRIRGGRKEVESSWTVNYPHMDEEPCHPGRLEIDNRDDYVYILDHVNSVIRRFTKDGRYLDSIWGADEAFSRPTGLSVQEGDRKVWVADTGNNIIQHFTLR